MKSMVTQVEEVLNEVGLCEFNDVVYKTTKLNEKRKNRNLTVIDKNTARSSVFSKGLRGYGTTTRNKDGRVISSPVNPNYWKEPEDPVTRYEKGLKKRAKERQRNTATSPTRAPGDMDDRQ